MSYNEKMVDRIRELIASSTSKSIEEKKMFGGLCFMVDEKMCVGVESERLMLRFNPERTDEIMSKKGASPMNFTSRVMKGFAFIDNEVLSTKKELNYWIQVALDFNSKAKVSKKKFKKQ